MPSLDKHARFQFLADAFEGEGGFAPRITWSFDGTTAGKRIPVLIGHSELIPYQRESAEKFAGRCAVAVYENHLRTACERFISFAGRRKPTRDGVDAPLVKLLLENADLRGSSLDQFLISFALQAKARGSMLLLLDNPAEDDDSDEGGPAKSLADQIERRKVPYLCPLKPEQVAGYEIDAETGLLEWVELNVTEDVDGTPQRCVRRWDATKWSLNFGGRVVKAGTHNFGACPVLAFTENGGLFPQIGKFAQVADLSRRLFNARSELDEILRGQTFSLLTLQVTAEQASTFNAATTAATIGTHSMLVHQGIAPSFIAPDSGPAETYEKVIDQLQAAIRRVSMDDSTEQGAQAESGIARRMRFEQLNADVSTFCTQLQQLERRVWILFHNALTTTNRVTVSWPTDFNLIDTLTELDILDAMMRTGFPHEVLNEKRKCVVQGEFDSADEQDKADLLAAIDQMTQEPPDPGTVIPKSPFPPGMGMTPTRTGA